MRLERFVLRSRSFRSLFVAMPRTRPRPALVLSVAEFNRRNGHTLLAMITTAAHTRWPSDHIIRDLPPTGLRTACVVRWKLFTLDNRVLRRRIGRLGDQDADECRALIGQISRLAAVGLISRTVPARPLP